MANIVADQFVETLVAAGVKRIYGIVGDSLNGLTDAIRRQGKIEWVHVRHEEVAAFAAGAEAHLTGELAVCAGSCGPGNLHLINGLFDCHRSRVPVLAIAAHIPSAEIGSGYFQETHPEIAVPGMQPLLRARLGRQPDAAHARDRDPRGGRQARRIGRRDARRRRAAARRRRAGAEGRGPAAAAAHRYAGAERSRPARRAAQRGRARHDPVRLGMPGAHDELIALGERLKAPMVHALRGKEHVEWDNPYDVGMTGLIGFSSGYYAMRDCDVLLMLGTDFPYRQFYPRGTRCPHRAGRSPGGEHRPPGAGRSRRRRRCARDASTALLPLLEQKTRRHASRRRRSTLRQGAQGARRSCRTARRASGRSIRSRSPRRSATRRPRTPSSPAMSACRRCGPRAISR